MNVTRCVKAGYLTHEEAQILHHVKDKHSMICAWLSALYARCYDDKLLTPFQQVAGLPVPPHGLSPHSARAITRT